MEKPDSPNDEHLRVIRAMTSSQKMEAAVRLYWAARQFKEAGLRAQHPDWTDQQIEAKVQEIFLRART